MANKLTEVFKAPHSAAAQELFHKHFGDDPRHLNEDWLEFLNEIQEAIDAKLLEQTGISKEFERNSFWSFRLQILKDIWTQGPNTNIEAHARDPHNGYLYVIYDPRDLSEQTIVWLGRSLEPWIQIRRAISGHGSSKKLIQWFAELKIWAKENELEGLRYAKHEALVHFEETLEQAQANDTMSPPDDLEDYLWIPWKPIAQAATRDFRDGTPRESVHTEILKLLLSQGQPLLNTLPGRPKKTE